MRIGIIADTHGVLHPRVADVFANVDHIVHAGDVGGAHVLRELRKLAPVTYVLGNNAPEQAQAALTMWPFISTALFGIGCFAIAALVFKRKEF